MLTLMNRLQGSNSLWIWVLLLLVGVNLLGSVFHTRIDLTDEKRYTLSPPTKQLLKNLEEPVSISIFLSGDMPAGFQKLALSIEDLLKEFQESGKQNIQFKFKNQVKA